MPDYSSLRNGLVGAWCPSLGASGYRLIDRSGRGNHGDIVGVDAGTAWVGRAGRLALSFDGSNDTVDCGSSSALTPSVLSFTGWFYRTGDWEFPGACLMWAKPNGDFAGNGFYIEPNLSALKVICDGAATRILSTPTPANSLFPLNSWKHLAFVIVDGSGQIYIDGNPVNSSTSGVLQITANTDRKYFLSNSPAYGHFTASIADDIRVYNRAITRAEVALLASAPGVGLTIEPARNYFFVPVASGVTGSLTATLSNATVSSSGTVANSASGTLSQSLAAATVASTGNVAAGASGSLVATLSAASVTASGTIAAGASGSVSQTLSSATVSSSGTLAAGASGTLNTTLASASVSASGTVAAGASGTLSRTLDNATVSSSGSAIAGINGNLSATLAAATLTSSGTVANGASGSLSRSLDSCTVSSTGGFGAGLTAQLNVALASATAASTGTVANGRTGALSVTLASASLAASGTLFTPSTGKLFWVRVGGVWKETTPFVRVAGVWKQATPFVKVGGVWK